MDFEDERSQGGRSHRFLSLIGIGFAIGVIISLVALGSLVGSGPLELLAGEGWSLLGPPSTPAERLIAQGSVIDIAKKTQDSVVGIETRDDAPKSSMGGSLEGGSESVGSGVIIRDDGYIMTNTHVVGKASSIIVTLGEEKVPARIVGKDKDSDIAVIKVNRKRLPVASLGTTKNLQVGELAVAIGSPFGFQRSVTAGVISALNRHVTVGEEADTPRTYTNLIQTDAAINPGNSGGALINKRGEVIGINTLIYSTNGVSQGIGFAIPAEEAEDIATELVADGRVSRPFIGIEGRTVVPDASDVNTMVAEGALIETVTPGGPAERAGIEAGDVIVEFAGTKVTGMDDLVAAVRKTEISKDYPVKLLHAGVPQRVTIKPEERVGES